MEALATLIAQRDDLNRVIEARQAEARAESVTKAREYLAHLGITPADLAPARVSRKSPRPVAVKYRDAAGNTWTGRGFKPVWLRDALAAGRMLEDFKV